VHPTGGTLRVFGRFAWLEVGSVKTVLSRPTHQRVTHTVRWLIHEGLSMSKSFSSDYYDAANQYAAWSASSDRDRRRRALKARLRFDFLFSKNITLSRPDVLDGACFMLTTPEEIRDWLALEKADSPPITIMTKTGVLESDLLDWLRPADAERLYPEPFLVIPQTELSEFKTEFSRLPSSTVNSWKDLPTTISSVIGQDDKASELLSYWGSWIEQAPKCFNVVKFTTSVDHQAYVPKTLAPDLLSAYGLIPGSTEGNRTIELYENAVRAYSEAGWRRGALMDWFKDNLPGDSKVGWAVRDQINIGICRGKAQANNTRHETFTGAALLESTPRKSLLRWLIDDPTAKGKVPTRIGIPQDLSLWLSDCDYKELLRKVYRHRESWLLTNDVESLKKFAEAIANSISTDPAPLQLGPTQTTVNIIRAVGAIGGGLVAAYWDLTPGLGWYDGLRIIGGASIGAWEASKEKLDAVIKQLYKRQIVYQVLQSVRPRMGGAF
jgi:hypothetical protein